jgi:hypothetical protein
MAKKDVYINTKDLPQSTEIKNGTYIFVETPNGTGLIDFENFILPSENTLITPTVSSNVDAILSLSAEVASNFEELSAAIDSATTTTYVAKTTLTIPTGSRQASGIVLPQPTKTLAITDIVVVPANAYASKFNAYATDVNVSGVVTIAADFTRSTIVNTGSYNVGITSPLSSETLSSFSATGLLSGLSASPTDLSTFLTGLTLSSTSIPAEQDAIYNIIVIKN